MTHTLHAASTRPDVSVSVGYNGLVPNANRLIPVTVIISNNVDSVKGNIRITHRAALSSGSPEVTESTPFDSPSKSVKRYTILTRHQNKFGLSVSIDYSDSKYSDITIPAELRGDDRPIVLCLGALGRHPLRRTIQKRYRCVAMSGLMMPDNPLGYDSVYAVYITGPALIKLEPGQLRALHDWFNTGGIVLVASPLLRENDFNRNLKQLVGLDTLRAVRNGIGSSGLGTYAPTHLPVWAIGPENKWPTHSPLFQIFPLAKLKDTEAFREHFGTGLLTEFWADNATDGKIGIFSLFLIVLVYLLVIGPIDHQIVKRLKKPAFTWVIFTAAIIGFSFMAYGYTSMVNIGQMRAVMVHILDVSLDTQRARGNSRMWIYSAKNATYDLTTTQPDVQFSAHESSKGVGDLAFVQIESDREASIQTRIPIFSNKRFEAAWYTDWKHAVMINQQGGKRIITLPDDLKVTGVSLGSSKGYRDCSKIGASEWSIPNGHRSWSQLHQSVNQAAGFDSGYGSEGTKILPQKKDLELYLKQLTLPHSSNDENVYSPVERMDSRERSLSLKHVTDLGHDVLLIYIDPSSPLLPTTLSGGNPQERSACVIRMVLPKEKLNGT